jgi:cyanophycinase-like exopeptidase
MFSRRFRFGQAMQCSLRRGRLSWPALIVVFAAACASAAGPQPPDRTGPDPQPACGVMPAGAERALLGAPGAGVATPQRRLVLMGGSSEVNSAARLFVEAAGGGDVLTLRATGSTTSYNSYFFTSVGATPAPVSAVTIRTDSVAAGGAPSVLCHVALAEAIWLAGGNQWDYLGGWPTALHAALRDLVARGGAIGGTSAGAMALGEMAFDARNGGVTSAEALADPMHARVQISASPFAHPALAGWLVDSHFSERDREGRMLAFLARWAAAANRPVYGLALDERAAIVIENGSFTVHAAAGRAAWLYRVDGAADVRAGVPLGLDGIRRVRLEAGATGAWPPAFDALAADALSVVNGEVRIDTDDG